jgi:SSS family solute:Na+ symporter
MSAVIFIGLLWRRGNTAGAISGVVAGFSTGLVFFLDQTLKLSLPVLSHPYLNSFLHRSLIVWIVAALVMLGVSLATTPPAEEKVEGNVFVKVSHSNLSFGDYRVWAVILFLCTLVLWWEFR